MLKSFKIFAPLFIVNSLYAAEWYSTSNCSHIKAIGLYSPNELITKYKCKPTYLGEKFAGAAKKAMLAYDCRSTILNTFIVFQYTTEEKCKKDYFK